MRRSGSRGEGVRRWVGTIMTSLAIAAIVATLALAVPSTQSQESTPMNKRLVGSAEIRDGSLLLRDIKRGQLESRYLTISAAAAQYVKIPAAARLLAMNDPGPFYLKIADAEATYLKLADAASKYLRSTTLR